MKKEIKYDRMWSNPKREMTTFAYMAFGADQTYSLGNGKTKGIRTFSYYFYSDRRCALDLSCEKISERKREGQSHHLIFSRHVFACNRVL